MTSMVVCWAHAIGGCSSRQSGEHTISANVLEGETVYVSGFSWCADREVRLPVQRFRQNILCTKHNSDLSPTDTAGGELFRALGSMRTAAAKRLSSGKKPRFIRALHVNAPLVERWFLKSVINVGIERTKRAWWPPAKWVQLAFGVAQFGPSSGMYLLPSDWVGVDGSMWEIHCELLSHNGVPIGGIVSLDQLRFAICAEDYVAPEGWMRRPVRLVDSERCDRYQKLIFDW